MTPSKLKTIQIIHLAFCVSLFMFGAVSFIINKDRAFVDFSLQQPDLLFPLFPGVAIIFIAIGFFLFKQRLSTIDSSASFDDKIMLFQSAFVIRSAMFEGSALMNIVGFFVTGNLALLAVGAIIFGIFLSLRPTRDKIIQTLNLSYPDTEKL